MKPLLLILLVTGWLLAGCSDNAEMELKQNHTYQSVSLKVENMRVFTMHGEINDPIILNSIISKIKSEDPSPEIPVNKDLTNEPKVNIRFSGNEAFFSSGFTSMEFNVAYLDDFIRLTSKDTLRLLKVPAGAGGIIIQSLPYRLGKYFPEIIGEEIMPTETGFYTVNKSFFEIYAFYRVSELTIPHIFYYYYRVNTDLQNSLTGKISGSGTIQNVLEPEFYKRMQTGDTILVQEMNMHFK